MRPVRFRCAVLLVPALTACLALEEGKQRPVSSQRPGFSRSTATVSAGHVELESGLRLDPGDSVDTPMTVRWGFDQRSEVFVGFSPYVWIDFPSGSEESIGDVLVGYRARVREQTEAGPSVAVQLAAKLPIADEDEGFTTGEPDTFAAGMATWNESDWSATAFAQLGLLGQEDDSNELDAQYLIALAGSHTLDRPEYSAFGEIAGVFVPELNEDQAVMTMGLTWAWMPGRVFDAGVAFGLTDDAPDAVLLFGFTTGLGLMGPRVRER
jgi:hypothetical protein